MAAQTRRRSSIAGRVRGASVSIINANPQLGVWQAAGTAIAQAPNLTELRDPESGGDNITFNAQGHSARVATLKHDGELVLVRTNSAPGGTPASAGSDRPVFSRVFTGESGGLRSVDEVVASGPSPGKAEQDADESQRDIPPIRRRQSLYEKYRSPEKANWKVTVMNGLSAFWKFFITPLGFLITIYCLNIVVGFSRSWSSLDAALANTTRRPGG